MMKDTAYLFFFFTIQLSHESSEVLKVTSTLSVQYQQTWVEQSPFSKRVWDVKWSEQEKNLKEKHNMTCPSRQQTKEQASGAVAEGCNFSCSLHSLSVIFSIQICSFTLQLLSHSVFWTAVDLIQEENALQLSRIRWTSGDWVLWFSTLEL